MILTLRYTSVPSVGFPGVAPWLHCVIVVFLQHDTGRAVVFETGSVQFAACFC